MSAPAAKTPPASAAKTPTPSPAIRANVPQARNPDPADAILRVSTNDQDPAASARLDGGDRQGAVGTVFKTTSGRHVVKVENARLGVQLSCTITLASHSTTLLNVDLEGGRCEVVAQ